MPQPCFLCSIISGSGLRKLARRNIAVRFPSKLDLVLTIKHGVRVHIEFIEI